MGVTHWEKGRPENNVWTGRLCNKEPSMACNTYLLETTLYSVHSFFLANYLVVELKIVIGWLLVYLSVQRCAR